MTDDLIFFEEAGRTDRADYSFYRGENTNFHPNDASLLEPGFIDGIVKGLVPDQPIISKQTKIVAFGSCFAENISNYLHKSGYNVATKKDDVAYISIMGDGIVNTFAVLQQFEWAWEGKQPKVELWHGYQAKALGYDEKVRRATKAVLDGTDAFIITLGLSEVWFDEPTGEVFWRSVPRDKFDPARHKFRQTGFAENFDNLSRICSIINRHRPGAKIIFTLSPIPLTATFRPMSCVVASSASKAVLRAALDSYLSLSPQFYFPSYELVMLFNQPFMEDRRHVHKHVIDFIMAVFEKHFCGGEVDTDDAFRIALEMDRKVGAEGQWSVPRTNLKWSKP